MAQNPALTQLLADLNAAPHPGMGTDFFAHVGSHMALARTIPLAWFPKTGSATEAQIGGLIANLHSLILKLPLTIIFYIYACHRKDLHLLSHFVRLTLSYCGILCSIRNR